MISIALPKGRLGEKAYGVFEKIGLGCPAILENNQTPKGIRVPKALVPYCGFDFID